MNHEQVQQSQILLKNNPFNIPEDNINSNAEFRKTHYY